MVVQEPFEADSRALEVVSSLVVVVAAPYVTSDRGC